MSNPVILFIHFIATLARLLGPGGHSIVAESFILTAPPVLSSDTLPNSICVARSMSAAAATVFSLVDDARESDSLTYYQDVFSFFRVLEVAGFNEIGRALLPILNRIAQLRACTTRSPSQPLDD